MELNIFIEKLRSTPRSVTFDDTMATVEANYDFTETAFSNGNVENAAGQNSGSCKLFAFAQINELSVEETLACFGSYYREDVLGDPDGDSHQNIRNFMRTGWAGIAFSGEALKAKGL